MILPVNTNNQKHTLTHFLPNLGCNTGHFNCFVQINISALSCRNLDVAGGGGDGDENQHNSTKNNA
jgi:hypothetical protein